MEPSNVLIGLFCLALLVYLPKLRNTVFWICFPFVMVFVRFPKTRKPGLLLGCLGLAVGGVLFGVHTHRERHYWYCDIWSNNDHTQTPGRVSEQGMRCYRGLDPCVEAHDNAKPNSFADMFNDWATHDGEKCSHRYPSIWSYDLVLTVAGDATHPDIKMAGTQPFVTKQECEQARQANLADAVSSCYQDEKSTPAPVSGPPQGKLSAADLEGATILPPPSLGKLPVAAGAKPVPTDLDRAVAAGGKPVEAARPIVPDPGSVKPPAELQRGDDPFAAYLKPDQGSVKLPAEQGEWRASSRVLRRKPPTSAADSPDIGLSKVTAPPSAAPVPKKTGFVDPFE